MARVMQEVPGRVLVLQNLLTVVGGQKKIDEFLDEPANGMAAVFQFALQVRLHVLLPRSQQHTQCLQIC